VLIATRQESVNQASAGGLSAWHRIKKYEKTFMFTKRRIFTSASAAALVLAGTFGLATTPVWATQTVHICSINSSGTRVCILSLGAGPPVTDGATPSNSTAFTNINGSTWDGRPVYEWIAGGTSNCLERSPSTGRVIMAACNPGQTDQLWWQQTNGDWALESDGDCMYPNTNTSGPQVWLEACSIETQVWTTVAA
jgi:hypothetical protein